MQVMGRMRRILTSDTCTELAEGVKLELLSSFLKFSYQEVS